jgi:signal transduction histidine kinase
MIGPASSSALRIFSPIQQRFVVERFTIALLTGVLAVLLRGALDPVLGHVAFYVTVYMAVAFCAVVCGFLPAGLSAAVGFLGIFYWFVDPRHSLSLIRRSEIHGVIGFFFVSVVLIALGEANRRKQLKLNDVIATLTAEGRERERAQSELQKAHDELEQRVEERTAQLSQTAAKLETEVGVRKQAEDQLRRLTVRVMTLQDEERRRIARDLHDTTGQTLAAIKMTAGLLAQAGAGIPGLARLLDDLNSFADEALRDMRTTAYLLHPPLLDEAGIASAARWFVEGFAKRSGIAVQCDIPETFQRPNRNCELALFRVLQESLTNVHRHAEASSARVTLVPEGQQLRLEISDNGNGISEERVKQLNESAEGAGVGIAGMRERIRELGGALDIQSNPKGTTIRVLLPMASASESPASLTTTAA